jgi:hypothetical protein
MPDFDPSRSPVSPFQRLPGFVRSAPGLEHRLWRRLPALLLWGTLLPALLVGLNHLLAPDPGAGGSLDAAVLRWDFVLLGLVTLHWTLLLTVAIACFIVRVMKGPAYVADGYPLPERVSRAKSDRP